MEYGDQTGMTEDEKREICITPLQDMEPVDAACLILKHNMADVLRDSQIRNIGHEMLEEKLWEEYSDSSLRQGTTEPQTSQEPLVRYSDDL